MATAQQLVKIINGVRWTSFSQPFDAITTTPSIAKFKFRIHQCGGGAAETFRG